jgi:hypothetical protein
MNFRQRNFSRLEALGFLEGVPAEVYIKEKKRGLISVSSEI